MVQRGDAMAPPGRKMFHNVLGGPKTMSILSTLFIFARAMAAETA
jgi:hypothetical protein